MAIITATAGNDTITTAVSSVGPLTTGGNDSVLAQGGNDSVNGGSGLDTLRGGLGNDSLAGSNDNDFLFGDEGDDLFFGGAGNDRIDGGTGFDIVSFAANPTDGAVTVNVTNVGGVNTIISAPAPTILTQGADTITNVEQINGSNSHDTITLASVNSTLGFNVRGNAGNDSLVGTLDANTSIFLDYRSASATAGVSVDLVAGRATDGLGGIDTIANFVAVRGTELGDTLNGDAAINRFRGRAGNDRIDGRDGNDIADYSQATGAVSVNLATGRAQDGEGGTDTLVSIEEVWGTIGNDLMVGSGADEFFFAFAGADTINGGGGQDRVGFQFSAGLATGATQGVVVNLVTGVVTDGWGSTDRLTGIERVTGTAFADSMLGGTDQNRFRGRAGNDTLDGGLGGDYAEYNNATTGATVNLTTGVATDGEGGTDRLVSIENVIGGAFADRLTGIAQGGQSTSDLRGGRGDDTLVGIAGEYVRADYADQTQGLSINLASGSVADGSGATDRLINIRGAVLFGDFNDVVLGSAFGEWISPSEGADSVNGLGGFDIISYTGADVGGVSVNLAVSRARDTGGDTDTILGFEGISASFGDDTLTGSAIGNLIGPGAGADLVNALGGADTLSYSLGFSPGGTHFTSNEAGDRLQVQGVTIDLITARATDYGGSLDTIIGFENAIGGTAADIIRGTNLGNYLAGAEGNDTLEGRSGNDTLDGEAGNDRLVGGIGDDFYLHATGDVVFELLNQGIDTVSATQGTAFTLGANLDALVLAGATLLNGTGNGLANSITGNDNANLLQGVAGDDALAGGGGNDTLVGGADADTLQGGTGADHFRFALVSDSATGNPDVILDFTYSAGAGFDKIDLRTIDANAAAAGNQAFTWIGTTAFAGTGAASAGQLGYDTVAAGIHVIRGDTNGDGTADLSIVVASTFTPVQAWFFL
ncbi:calcium-binding protein [Roseomonas sp. CECT 9278]|uniref:beta strand repeat-containing protein n=1 Tax=Roseomonas sp. CECT 9278 TaxID=2845823 RepID=UPI001E443927|nr:calcium-binding protein [Roseomonas sp. CECT 9278]CAH0270649.1 hypothetical protein ROS9278_03655 [Roseomonas sp. CECT 9278]